MLRIAVLAILAAAISAVPCPFNDQCTCTSESITTHVDSGSCKFTTGNEPSFPTKFTGSVYGLSVQHVNDMSLPDNVFANIPALSSVRFVNTSAITTIGAKAFSGLSKLNTLTFDRFTDANLNDMRKPLADLPKLNQFYMTKSAFKVVDWADFSESSSRDLDVYFKQIDLVTVTPTEKFAYDIEFKAYGASIENIDKSVGVLLNKEKRSRLLLDDTKLGPCENFNWMTTIRCPSQNDIDRVTCVKNGARVSLTTYLKTVDPNSTCRGAI